MSAFRILIEREALTLIFADFLTNCFHEYSYSPWHTTWVCVTHLCHNPASNDTNRCVSYDFSWAEAGALNPEAPFLVLALFCNISCSDSLVTASVGPSGCFCQSKRWWPYQKECYSCWAVVRTSCLETCFISILSLWSSVSHIFKDTFQAMFSKLLLFI